MRIATLALTAGALACTAGAPVASAAGPTPTPTEIVGQLGYVGGAPPEGFHPTAGTVEVEFTVDPIVLVKKVGPSGKFVLRLEPGEYTLIGCGPASSTGSAGPCGQPVTVTLAAGEVDHVRLVWAYVP
jgi:hypothetical protein